MYLTLVKVDKLHFKRKTNMYINRNPGPNRDALMSEKIITTIYMFVHFYV